MYARVCVFPRGALFFPCGPTRRGHVRVVNARVSSRCSLAFSIAKIKYTRSLLPRIPRFDSNSSVERTNEFVTQIDREEVNIENGIREN